MKILVCTEGRAGILDSVSLELLFGARQIAGPDGEVVALVVGSDAADAQAKLGSADRVVVAIDPALAVVTAEAYARIAGPVIAQEAPDIVLVAYSATGLDLGPHLAAASGAELVAYVIKLARDGAGLVATSQLYGGKILAETQLGAPAVLMINPGALPEAEARAASTVQRIEPGGALDGQRIELIGEDAPSTSDIDLSKAERIVCVGRGIGEEASIEQVRDLASLLGAEIAGSRPVVDNGWLPKLRQVGKSGRTVKPRLYLALGVSGAPEHLEGMARSDLIIAVNTDPKAPIFAAAHFGATCDLFDLVAALSDRLRGGAAP